MCSLRSIHVSLICSLVFPLSVYFSLQWHPDGTQANLWALTSSWTAQWSACHFYLFDSRAASAAKCPNARQLTRFSLTTSSESRSRGKLNCPTAHWANLWILIAWCAQVYILYLYCLGSVIASNGGADDDDANTLARFMSNWGNYQRLHSMSKTHICPRRTLHARSPAHFGCSSRWKFESWEKQFCV